MLKPGAVFAGFEWVLTHKFDDKNEIHLAVKKGIEEGNGLADMFRQDYVIECMKAAGFEVLEARDVGEGQDLPWFNSLGTTFKLGEGYFFTKWGRWSSGTSLSSMFASAPSSNLTFVFASQQASWFVCLKRCTLRPRARSR